MMFRKLSKCMLEENRIVNSLWVGRPLSALEFLTLQSFSVHGHEFHLWVYDELGTDVPDNVVIRDARDIIPENKVFQYRTDGKIDWGRGSYAGFSDLFRFKLLHERGGWWVDMDVTCLKPLDFSEPYFFRNHWKFPVVGNVMKVPQGCPAMIAAYEAGVTEINANNSSWHRPIEILNEKIAEQGLMGYRRTGLFNLDIHEHVKNYLRKDLPIPNDWYGIHWINSSGTLKFRKESTFTNLLRAHEVAAEYGRKQNNKWFVDWFKSLSS